MKIKLKHTYIISVSWHCISSVALDSSCRIYLKKTCIYLVVQSHPKPRGDFGQTWTEQKPQKTNKFKGNTICHELLSIDVPYSHHETQHPIVNCKNIIKNVWNLSKVTRNYGISIRSHLFRLIVVTYHNLKDTRVIS